MRTRRSSSKQRASHTTMSSAPRRSHRLLRPPRPPPARPTATSAATPATPASPASPASSASPTARPVPSSSRPPTRPPTRPSRKKRSLDTKALPSSQRPGKRARATHSHTDRAPRRSARLRKAIVPSIKPDGNIVMSDSDNPSISPRNTYNASIGAVVPVVTSWPRSCDVVSNITPCETIATVRELTTPHVPHVQAIPSQEENKPPSTYATQLNTPDASMMDIDETPYKPQAHPKSVAPVAQVDERCVASQSHNPQPLHTIPLPATSLVPTKAVCSTTKADRYCAPFIVSPSRQCSRIHSSTCAPTTVCPPQADLPITTSPELSTRSAQGETVVPPPTDGQTDISCIGDPPPPPRLPPRSHREGIRGSTTSTLKGSTAQLPLLETLRSVTPSQSCVPSKALAPPSNLIIPAQSDCVFDELCSSPTSQNRHLGEVDLAPLSTTTTQQESVLDAQPPWQVVRPGDTQQSRLLDLVDRTVQSVWNATRNFSRAMFGF